jgi:hypothetical protein
MVRLWADYLTRRDAASEKLSGEGTMNEQESLLQEIAKNAATVERYGLWNYRAAWAVAIISVGASIVSSIMAALGTVDKTWVAILAAIPAAALTVTTTFNFEQRGIAHFDTKKQLNALARKAKYEGASLEDVSKQYSMIDLATFRGWTRYSTLTRQYSEQQEAPLKAVDVASNPLA